MTTTTSTSDLLPRIARGDQAAVAGCLDRYGGLVYALARRRLGPGPDTEDLVQDVFVELWRKADRFDPGRGSEATFIATLARRRIIDRLRQRTRGPAVEPLPPDPAPPEPDEPCIVEQADEVRKVESAMAKLNESQQEAVRLAVCEGLTHRQIAEQTAQPLGTVKTNVRRGLHRLRDLLGVNRPSPATGEVTP